MTEQEDWTPPPPGSVGPDMNGPEPKPLPPSYSVPPPVGQVDFSKWKPDPVNHPPHYKQGSIECIDAIRAALTEEEFRGYCKGNVLKYVWRERHKGGDQDLGKATFYMGEIEKK